MDLVIDHSVQVDYFGRVDALRLNTDLDLVLGGRLRPGQTATLRIERQDRRRESVPLLVRIDTAIEAAYFLAGGIMPYVLEQLLAQQQQSAETS